jgi:hypothetical protein
VVGQVIILNLFFFNEKREIRRNMYYQKLKLKNWCYLKWFFEKYPNEPSEHSKICPTFIREDTPNKLCQSLSRDSENLEEDIFNNQLFDFF